MNELPTTFEIVPTPGIEDDVERLLAPGARLAIPHLASHGLQRTVDVAVELAARGFVAVPHLAARGIAPDDQLERQLDRLRAAGVDELLVVGGDARTSRGRYPDAAALVAALADRFDRIGVAGHPEGDESLDAALLGKQDLGVAYVATQMCFTSGPILDWITRIRARGVHLPIVLGLPGAVSTPRLIRLGLRLGVGSSLRTLRGNQGLRRQLTGGAFAPRDLLDELAAVPIAGLHVFTFNELGATLVALSGEERGLRGRVW